MRNLMNKFSAAEIAVAFKQAAKVAYEAP